MAASAYTPFDVSTKDRVVGIFVIGALFLFLIGFLIPFIQSFANDEGVPFYTVLDQTYGIAPDAAVSLRGVVIGRVSDVGITPDGLVRVDISLSPVYVDFYTNKSTLSVDSNLGVSTLLTGSGLVLSPGNSNNGRLTAGEFIPTDVPQSFGSLLEELDIVALTDQLTEIVNNVESITTGFAQNQDKIYQSIDNLEQVTQSLAEVSQELPGMVKSVDSSLVSLQNSMAGVDRIVVTTEEDLSSTLKNAVVLTEQATKTLAETEVLFQASTPVMNQLPTVLVTTDAALQSINELTDQMAQSWLFGGGDGTTNVAPPLAPTAHPYDDSIYILESTNNQ